MTKNETVIRETIQAWSRLNPVESARYFTDDGIYHSMPIDQVQGVRK